MTTDKTLGWPLALLLWLGAGCEKPATNNAGSSATATATSTAAATTQTAKASAAPPPEPVVQAPPSNVPDSVDGANATAASLTVEGMTFGSVKCRSAGGGGMFGALAGVATAVAPLAKQKGALDACVHKPADVRVHYLVKDKKATDIRVADAPDAKSAACIAKAIEAAEFGEGGCVVTLKLGAPTLAATSATTTSNAKAK
jgi:hypothetical protein